MSEIARIYARQNVRFKSDQMSDSDTISNNIKQNAKINDQKSSN